MRQGLVSVGIVMMLAGTAQTGAGAATNSRPDQTLTGANSPIAGTSAWHRQRQRASRQLYAASDAVQPPPIATPPPPAPAPRFDVTAGTEFLASSSYVWRGFQPNSSFSVQPNTWVKIDNLTVSSWMNIARRHVEHRPVTEHDLTIDYSATRGAFTWSAGWINYVFPEVETGRYSNELYAGFSHSSYLNPSFRVYQDVHAGTGTYVNVGVSHTYPVVSSKVTLMPSVALGYNHRQWIDTSRRSATSTWACA